MFVLKKNWLNLFERFRLRILVLLKTMVKLRMFLLAELVRGDRCYWGYPEGNFGPLVVSYIYVLLDYYATKCVISLKKLIKLGENLSFVSHRVYHPSIHRYPFRSNIAEQKFGIREQIFLSPIFKSQRYRMSSFSFMNFQQISHNSYFVLNLTSNIYFKLHM